MNITSKSFKRLPTKIRNINPITTFFEFQKYIEYFEKKWGDELWYRGVPTTSFKLIPGIYRENVWKYDLHQVDNIINDFIHRAKGYLPNARDLNKWEWYQLMQHYGLPTRLLDWTSAFSIALYFALRYFSENTNPCVWVLNPYNLNYSSTKKRFVYFTDAITRSEEDIIVDNYLFDKTSLPNYPIAIYPPYTNNRLSAQKSCFTVHGHIKTGFENLFKEKKDFELVQLVIEKSKSSEIKKFIIKSGITESTLFPDLEGLSRELMFEYNMSF